VASSSDLTNWFRTHDLALMALRRGTRTAIVMPVVFAISLKVIGNPAMATFSAFGSLAMLLFAAFSGTMRERLQAEVLLALAGALLVGLGTLCSTRWWLGAPVMAGVALVVLFSGVLSSELAGATTGLLLSFILPVATSAPASSIPWRLAGWGLAGAASTIAISVMWPAPTRHPLGAPALAATRRLAERMRAEAAWLGGDPGWKLEDYETAVAEAHTAVESLRLSFYATPYRPTGLSLAARTVVSLVEELRWLSEVLDGPGRDPPHGQGEPLDPTVLMVTTAAADVMERAADLLQSPIDSSNAVAEAEQHLRAAVVVMQEHAQSAIPLDRSAASSSDEDVEKFVRSLDTSFRAEKIKYSVLNIASYVGLVAAADKRSWWAKLAGRQPEGAYGTFAAAKQRVSEYLRPHSVWLHNSIRGAIGLGLAVLVADLTSVEHSFWVVLGTLSVLRSSALSTGQNVLRALLGTTGGVVLGGVLVWVIGANTTVLWALLPVAIVLAGVAPAAISFTAGQVAFTVTLLVLYNIVAPVGWSVGIVRVEDVAVGTGVSLLVGLLFWPRGARSELALALAEAYASGATYLRAAVSLGARRCGAPSEEGANLEEVERRTASAGSRLDDAFRTFLSDRGTKLVPLAEVSTLLNGTVRLHTAAEAISEFWSPSETAVAGDRSAAWNEVLSAGEADAEWYGSLARALGGHELMPEPRRADVITERRLADALRRDVVDTRGAGSATAVRIMWTLDALDSIRRYEEDLVAPAADASRLAASRRTGLMAAIAGS
jgi:uncharacterized membrane protein YccC